MVKERRAPEAYVVWFWECGPAATYFLTRPLGNSPEPLDTGSIEAAHRFTGPEAVSVVSQIHISFLLSGDPEIPPSWAVGYMPLEAAKHIPPSPALPDEDRFPIEP